MTARRHLWAFVLLLSTWSGTSHAAALLIPAALATDMAYDFRRGRIYIANGNEILRYSVARQSFLSSIPMGDSAVLKGIDISPDGTRLAVADQNSSDTELWVHLLDLTTLVDSVRKVSKAESESGMYSVAFAADRTLITTSSLVGSGWVPMRRLDLSTGAWAAVTDVRQDTMLSPSTDRQTIAFAEANISDGTWGVYDVPTKGLVRRQGYTDGTSNFNYEITTDAMGGRFAIPTYHGLYLYDADFQLERILGEYAGPRPLTAAYHPVENLLYCPWAETSTVRVFNARTRGWVSTIQIEDDLGFMGGAYTSGRIKLSADGSLVMVVVPGGVRYVRQYAPLAAAHVGTRATSGVSKDITLKGSVGNNGALTYSILQRAQHGSVKVSGGKAIYRSVAGYHGSDSFKYRVRYGAAAVADATVNVTVP